VPDYEEFRAAREEHPVDTTQLPKLLAIKYK